MNRIHLQQVTDCTDCGVCCLHMRSPPFVGSYLVDGKLVLAGDDDPYKDHSRLMSAPPEARQALIDGLHDGRPAESPCSWFDPTTKQCRWWKFRPNVCRAYEVGGESCLRERREHGIVPAKRFRMVAGRLVTA